MSRAFRWVTASALCSLTSLVQAAPITYDFTVTGTSGPMAGQSSSGSFTFDSSVIPVGGGNVSQTGLLTDLSFTWDGFSYTEANANTGALNFDASGQLILALFGSNCGGGSCSASVNTNDWFFRWGTDGALANLFTYGGIDALYQGDPSATPRRNDVPEPTVPALVCAALAALTVRRSTRRAN